MTPDFMFADSGAKNHLVFSYFYRSISLAYTYGAILIVILIYGAFTTDANLFTYTIDNTDTILILALCVFVFSKLTCQQQARIGWVFFKLTMLLFATLMATVGFFSSYSNGKSDAFPNLFTGLVWLPSIELIPRLQPYQKYISVARIVLTIPCVYFGVKSGYWHW